MNAEDTARLVALVHGLSAGDRRTRNLALLQQPPLFDIEVVSACNVECSFCPRSKMVRRSATMSPETFQAVESFLPPGAVAMFSGLGDALLHSQLEDWTARLTDRGISCCVVTNGVRLTPDRQRALHRAGMAQFQVSMHGVEPAQVERIVTRGARPARVFENLEHLARWRPRDLRVRLNFVETPENVDSREHVQALAERSGFDFYWRRVHTRGGTVGRTHPHDPSGCGIFASVTFISCDGDILPCVNDVSSVDGHGNVADLTWDDALAWKQQVIERDRWFEACGTCDDDYRWVIIGQMGVDEASEAVSSSPCVTP